MAKKILIAGANGHLGHVAVKTALDRGYSVVAADITDDRLKDIKSKKLEFIKVDVTNPDTLKNIFTGVSAVVSTVGLWRERGKYSPGSRWSGVTGAPARATA